MRIEVRLFATLASHLPENAVDGSAILDVLPGLTADGVLRSLRVPEDMPRIMLVNGRDAAPEQPLQDGDVVSVFPPLAGGTID